ncbi:MAG TPA: ion transporter [Bacteroidales bacterium]|nr:ion transporter [Bacteroidales bacterium]
MPSIRKRLYEIIFESDTRAGRMFNVVLLSIIMISVILVMLESVGAIRIRYLHLLRTLEWVITVIFTLEYLARMWVVDRPLKYSTSFYGIIDLMALLPTYLDVIFTGGHSLIVLRLFRMLRVFRILKLSQYSRAGRLLVSAMWDSRQKISVFIVFVLLLAVIIGTVMYLVEGNEHGFSSIPRSIYWAIVTLTTVGYGDLSPSTGLGQFCASIIMILGYAIIAIPTGIVTAAFITKRQDNTQICSNCYYDKHDDDAEFCKRCGTRLTTK